MSLKADMTEIQKLTTAITYKADKTTLEEKINEVNNRINNLSTTNLEDRISSQESYTQALNESINNRFNTVNTNINNLNTTLNGKIDNSIYNTQIESINNALSEKALSSEVSQLQSTINE